MADMKSVVAAELKQEERASAGQWRPVCGEIVWYQDQYQLEPLAATVTHVYPGKALVLNLCVYMQRGDAVGMTQVSRDETGATKGTWRRRVL